MLPGTVAGQRLSCRRACQLERRLLLLHSERRHETEGCHIELGGGRD